MSIETIYRCDHCHEQIEHGNDADRRSVGFSNGQIAIDLCPSCKQSLSVFKAEELVRQVRFDDGPKRAKRRRA